MANADWFAGLTMLKSPIEPTQAPPRRATDDAPTGVGDSRLEAQGNNPLNFPEIYNEHFDFVWRFAAHRGVPQAALEDVAQETFLVVSRQLQTFAGHSTLRTWIAGIAHNVLRAYLRKRGNQVVGDPLDEATAVPSLEPIPLEVLERKSATELLDSVLRKMTDKQREVFILCEVEGFTTVETAETLGVNENTMRARLHDARKLFNAVGARLRAEQAWNNR